MTPTPDQLEAVRQARRKLYAKARRYWESVGDSAKATMTDEELDEQFAHLTKKVSRGSRES